MNCSHSHPLSDILHSGDSFEQNLPHLNLISLFPFVKEFALGGESSAIK